MASLFQGTPQTATSYVTSSTETPKWLQDAIYNQIQWSQNVANAPFQAYGKPLVAGLNPAQQQAYSNIQQNQGEWLSPLEAVRSGTASTGSDKTFQDLQSNQNSYLNPTLASSSLQRSQQLLDAASRANIPGVSQANIDAGSALTRGAVGNSSLQYASPYFATAGQSSVNNIQSYMNPYQQGVMDMIAKQGAKNLSENLLPAVSDSFIRAGQFGSGRMGEFGSRALRDTQDAVLREQSQAGQQGYAQALQASQGDLARQAQLGSSVGSLAAGDLSRVLQAGSQLANIGQTQGQLENQQAQLLSGIGQAQSGIGQGQQQLGLQAASSLQGAESQDLSRNLSALQMMAQLAQQKQAMRTADNAALESSGLAQQNLNQRQLDSDYQQYLMQLNYPKQQLDFLSTQVRGLAPITPQVTNQNTTSTGQSFSASPLQQLAAGLATFKGIQNI